MAAAQGEYNIFTWAFSHIDPLFECGGRNVLHIAIESGQVCIVKQLLLFNKQCIPAINCNAEGINAYTAAFLGESIRIADILTEAYDAEREDALVEQQQYGAIWHGLRSEHSSVREWACGKTLEAEALCFLQFLQEEKSSKAVWSFFLSLSEQLDYLSIMNENGSAMVDTLLHHVMEYDNADWWAFLTSPYCIAGSIILKSIHLNRLDIVLHIIHATFEYVDDVVDVHWSPTHKIRRHLKSLSQFATQCNHHGLAAVIADLIPGEDKKLYAAEEVCLEFDKTVTSNNSDIDALNNALARHDAALQHCPAEAAASLGGVAYYRMHPSTIYDRIMSFISHGGYVRNKMDWVFDNIASPTFEDSLKLLQHAASYGVVSTVECIFNIIKKEWDSGCTDADEVRDALLKAVINGCGSPYPSMGAGPMERYGAGYPAVVNFLTTQYLSMGFNINHECKLILAVTHILSLTASKSSWLSLRWLFEHGGVNISHLGNYCEEFVKKISDERPHADNPEDSRVLLGSRILLLDYFVEKGLDLRSVSGGLIQELNNKFRIRESICCHHEFIAFGECLSKHGMNIQRLRLARHSVANGSESSEHEEECHQATTYFASLKEKQLQLWRVADSINGGSPLSDIKSAVSGGVGDIKASKDRDGKPLLHVAALHNRLDVMVWLLSEYEVTVTERDADGRTALQLSRAAGASECEQHLRGLTAKDMIIQFAFLNFHRRRILKMARVAHNARIHAVGLIQRNVRMYLMFRVYGPYINQACHARERFGGIWSSVVECLQAENGLCSDAFSWSEEKFKYDMMVESMASPGGDLVMNGEESRNLGSSEESLGNANNDIAAEKQLLNELSLQTVASTEHTESNEQHSSTAAATLLALTPIDGSEEGTSTKKKENPSTPPPAHTVELTHGVCKWLEQAEANYREMFASRIARLAHGDSTYALAKPLHTSTYRVFEAKLDAGQRILWTKILRESTSTILVSNLVLLPFYVPAPVCFLF